jgi:ubiquinone/menaquinone biosynthesis C-methylase UbiE
MMRSMTTSSANKEVYRTLHDEIIAKRFHSPFAIRRYAHHAQYQAIVDLVPSGSTVLDAGCGEGVLSVLLAKKGCTVTGVDLSEPNVAAARTFAAACGMQDHVTFLSGDAEHLPVPDKSFDYVVSSHVLEHVPDFVQGVRELARVARVGAVVAIPTCLNPASFALLGNDRYWTISRRTPFAIAIGAFRVLFALMTGCEGVNETYAGRKDLIHIFRFPWSGTALLRAGGLTVERYRASSFPVPYLPFLVPVSRLLDHLAWLPVARTLGFGTTYFCRP